MGASRTIFSISLHNFGAEASYCSERRTQVARTVPINRRQFAQTILEDQHKLIAYVLARGGGHQVAEDVVQDVLVKAIAKLPEYAKERPIAFYPWLRQLAWEQMVETFRVHVAAQRRSVDREINQNLLGSVPLPDQSAVLLADVLVAQQSTPSHRMEREQMREQVQFALGTIAATYREVLIMRYLEELSMREIAECVGATESAIKMRHMRALKQLGKALSISRSSDG